MYLSYQQVTAVLTVKTQLNLTIPAKATFAELRADTNPIRYTMDNATDPTPSSGMVLAVADEPKLFNIEDLRRIRFCRGAGADGNLNIHYGAGRDI